MEAIPNVSPPHDSKRITGRVPPMPIRIPPHEKVALVDVGSSIKAQAQPTTLDLQNAIQDLSKKISQLSKNQHALESQLTNIYSMGTVDNGHISGTI